jgi:hypothetical protein
MKFILKWIIVFSLIWLSAYLLMSTLEYKWLDPFLYFSRWTLESTTKDQRLGLIILLLVNLFVSLGITIKIEEYIEGVNL